MSNVKFHIRNMNYILAFTIKNLQNVIVFLDKHTDITIGVVTESIGKEFRYVNIYLDC